MPKGQHCEEHSLSPTIGRLGVLVPLETLLKGKRVSSEIIIFQYLRIVSFLRTVLALWLAPSPAHVETSSDVKVVVVDALATATTLAAAAATAAAVSDGIWRL